MARTAAFALLRRSLAVALACDRSGLPDELVLERSAQRARIGRREFGRRSASALTAALLARATTACRPHGSERIAVIGAGLAGLLCAYRLRQAGVQCTIFEAQPRVGGRLWSARGKFAEGQLAELGGEFIDTEHATLRALAAELELPLDDLTSPSDVRAQTLFFAGQVLQERVLVEAFRPVAARIRADLALAKQNPAEFARLDRLGLAGWLDAQPELDPTLRRLLAVAYLGEYGLEIDEQSAFNLLWLIDSETPDALRLYGSSDERFHTRGGNDQLPARLAERLHGQLELGQRLLRIRQRASGVLALAFEASGRTLERDFDSVVLALPFSLLRHVELDLPLPAAKRAMIEQLGYGTNAKLIGQFHERAWLTRQRASGSSLSDLAPQSTWDTSRAQSGVAGLLTLFLGGHAGSALGRGSAEARMLDCLPDLDTIFAGSAAAYSRASAVRMHWPSMPFTLGSYACYRPGQAAWSGREGVRVGRVHFCGEHTSENFQGYMQGAAESGERVAREILGDLGHPKASIRHG
jgi:monoamine oxidase